MVCRSCAVCSVCDGYGGCADPLNFGGIATGGEVDDAKPGTAGYEFRRIAVRCELDACGGRCADSGGGQLAMKFVVYVSAADQLNAGFGGAQCTQKFPTSKANRIHPDAVQQDWWVMHKQGTAAGGAGLQPAAKIGRAHV